MRDPGNWGAAPGWGQAHTAGRQAVRKCQAQVSWELLCPEQTGLEKELRSGGLEGHRVHRRQCGSPQGLSPGKRPGGVTPWAQPWLGAGSGLPRTAGSPGPGGPKRSGSKLEGVEVWRCGGAWRCRPPCWRTGTRESRAQPELASRGPAGCCPAVRARLQHGPFRGAALCAGQPASPPPRPPALLRSAGRGKRPWPPELAPSPEKGKTQGLACASLAERPPSASTPNILPKRGQLAWLVAGGWGDSTGKGWGQKLTPDLWHALWYGSHLSLRLGCHIPQGPQTSPTSGWTLVKAKEQGPSCSPQF